MFARAISHANALDLEGAAAKSRSAVAPMMTAGQFISGLLRLRYERIRLQLDLLDRLQVVHHCVGFVSGELGVEVQRESMRAAGIDQLRLEREELLHRIDLAHHGGAEDIDSRALLQQVLDDVPPPHMRRAAETAFPVSIAP